jgi:ParB/RepB/Spo0J family partition protein
MHRRGSGGAEALLAERVASRTGLSTGGAAVSDSPFAAMFGAVGGGMFEVPLERLRPDPGQPRRHFDDQQLEDLAANMKVVGQIEPAIIRSDPDLPGRFIIVVGERRWRAAEKAGVPTLQCIVRAEDARLVPAKQWSENHFRTGLSPIEEAGGLKAIMEIEQLDVGGAAHRYGISERTIRRHLQLLDAPLWIQAAVVNGEDVKLEDGSTEVRKLDLTGAVELLRTYNNYVRREQTMALGRPVKDDEAGANALKVARARAQRRAEAVKQRALRESWSRRKWQAFAAAAGKQPPANGECETARAAGRLFQMSKKRLTVYVQNIQASSAADLQRLAQRLSELLEQVRRQAKLARDVESQMSEREQELVTEAGSGPAECSQDTVRRG